MPPTRKEDLKSPEDKAFEEGYTAGFEAGATDGHADGYREGHGRGIAEGRHKGYEEGYAEAREIVALCIVAEMPAHASSFLEQSLSVESTRKLLQTINAEVSDRQDIISAVVKEKSPQQRGIRYKPEDLDPVAITERRKAWGFGTS